MNSLAQQALDRARQAPARPSKLLPPVLANEPLPELVITGPINRVMELEGKRFAVAFVQALGPSIHMPHWVSRILLEVTAVRIERLQDITEDQAQAEGIGDHEFNCGRPAELDGYPACSCGSLSYVDSFQRLWESINGADAWAANPWVWVVEFKRVTPP